MTDWKEDLYHLLTDTDPDPVEDILGSAVAQPVVGALASNPANYLFKTLDAPFSVVRGAIGSAQNLAQGEGLGGIEQGQQQWDENLRQFREADLGPLGILKTPIELGLNVALDPTTWTGLGLAGKAARGLRAASEVGSLASRPALSTIARGTARGLETAQAINDVPGRKALEGVTLPRAIPRVGGTTVGIQPLFRAGGRGLERLKPGILQTSDASRISKTEDLLNDADQELLAARMHPQAERALPATEQPLFHGSTEEGLSTLQAELPIGERGNPNAASTLGVFTTPHRYMAEDYAKGALDARVPDPVTGEVTPGFVYTADAPPLQNPIFMELHDYYGDFVRTDKKAFEDAARFKAESMAAGHDGIMVVRASGMGKPAAQLSPDDIREVIHFNDLPVRPAHWNPLLTAETNELFDTPVPRVAGEEAPAQTYGQFLDEHEAARQADVDLIRAKGFDWEPGLKLKEVEKIVADDPQVTKIVRTWFKDHRADPLHVGDVRAVARADLVDVLEKDAGITYTRSTVPSLLVGAWKTVALATPRFVASNLQGNMMAQAVKGIRPTFGWREYAGAFQASNRGKIVVTADEALESSSVTQWARENGDPYAPQEMFRGGSRGFAGADRYAPNPLGELVGRATRSQKLANLATHMVKPFEHLAMAADSVARGGTWKQTSRDAMTRMKPDYDARVAAKLAEVGVTDEVFSTVKGIGLPEEGMFAQPLKQRFLDLGLKDGDATHLTRAWREMWNKAKAEGKVKTNQIMFDYSRTNLDEMVGKLVPFHYWPSRSLRFWGEESFRNPAIPLNYMRMTDGIEDAERNPGMSARQKGFLHVMGTSLGFSLLMNPDALFGFAKVLNLDSAYNEPETEIDPLTGEERPKDTSFTPQGETQLGGVLRFLREKGIGLYPWFDSAFNVMGTYGNTFEPDFLPIRHKALLGAAVNEFRAHSGMEPIGAPYADMMGNLRQGVSTAVSAFLPDGMEPWLAEPVMARAGGSSQEANLDTIIEAEILARNPGLTNGQMLEIMSDPHSDEYERAYATVSDAGLINELLGLVVPWSTKLRHDGRDVTRAQVEVVQEEADRRGVAPWELAPTKDDLAFNAKYKRLTGKDYEPGDYETAKLKHDISRAPAEAKPYLLAEAEYHTLGTPKQRGHYEAYTALLVGTDPAVAGLSDAGRQALADEYLTRHPKAREAVDEIRAIRDAYETSHPEFAAFKAWQKRMFDLNEQLGGNLTEYRRQASMANPNLARYFEDQQEWIRQNEPDELKRDERLEQVTTNMGAYLSVIGLTKWRSVPGAIPGSPPVDLTMLSMTPPGESYAPTGNDWSRQLAAFGLPGMRQRI